jgi:hypothetical protein
MDNAMVAVGHGRAASRRILVRLALMAVAFSAVVATVMALFQREAEAQNPFAQIVCPILINLAAAFSGLFGGFLAGLFSSLLSAFGCDISG